MILGYPGYNSAYGRFVRVGLSNVMGTFVAGERLLSTVGPASGSGFIRNFNAALGYLDIYSGRAKFVTGMTVAGEVSGAAATVSTAESYQRGRAEIVAAQTTGLAAGYYAHALQTYDLSDAAKFTVNTSARIVFDTTTGAALPTPRFVLLSGFRTTYDYRLNNTPLTTIVVEQADDAAFTLNIEALAASTDGPGAFGQSNLYIPLTYPGSPRQFLRLRLISSSFVTVGIGNLWIGSGIDSEIDEGWNFTDGFEATNIDRGRYAETEGGAISRVHRAPIRRYDVMARINRRSWDKFADAVEGRMSRDDFDGSVIDDPSHPWAVCLDPDNKTRLVTGRHIFSGLFRLDGNVSVRDTGARDSTGVFFLPDIPLNLREWR